MTSRLGWMRVLAAVASGLLVAGLFPPYDFSWLVWIALMPILSALLSIEGKRAGLKGFGIGMVGGVVSCLIQFNWVATVSWVGAIVLPLYLALYWGLFGWFAGTIGRPGHQGGVGRSLFIAFANAAVWGGLEWARGWMLTGFGWNNLGVALQDNLVMAQGADLLGIAGLAGMLVFFQALMVLGLREGIARRVGARWLIRAAALTLLLTFVYGKVRIGLESRAESIRLKALLVQINIPQEAARVLWTDLETHQAYEDETLNALERLKNPDGTFSSKWPDWVMWPEVALTGRIYFTDEGEKLSWQINHDTISQVRVPGPFTLIYGVNEQEAEWQADGLIPVYGGRAYNSIAVMSPEDELETYRKKHLVIFGETIPFVDSVPLLKRIYEQQSGTEYVGSFTAGESVEPVKIMVGDREIGAIPTVCFEDSVGRLTRKFVRPGPQVIINATNDGWFKESAAAAQHFSYARFRAIELRRPMLRSANTGVSAAVDTTGSVAHPDTGAPQILVDSRGSHFTRGSLLAEVKVPVAPSFSLYALIGDSGILLLAGIGLLGAFLTRPSRVEIPDS